MALIIMHRDKIGVICEKVVLLDIYIYIYIYINSSSYAEKMRIVLAGH